MKATERRRQQKLQRKRANQRAMKKRRSRREVPSSPPLVRMSEVIRHVAEPLIDEFAATSEDLEKFIGLTAAA